jgi:hypothetical protein
MLDLSCIFVITILGSSQNRTKINSLLLDKFPASRSHPVASFLTSDWESKNFISTNSSNSADDVSCLCDDSGTYP